MTLFAEQTYAATSTAAIAARAGLTDRTFYRYFPDKREVLFGGEARLEELLVDAVAATPPEEAVGRAMRHGLRALAADLQSRQALVRARASLIFSEPELAERELAKVGAWTAALAGCLEARHLPSSTAWLASELTIAVFRTAYRLWVFDPTTPDLTTLVDQMLSDAGVLLDRDGPGDTSPTERPST